MVQELKSLESTGAIKYIKKSGLPKGKGLLSGKWVFQTKYLPSGEVKKYKAR